MSAKHVLAIDAGTSAVRCLIADDGGHLETICRRKLAYQSPPNAGLLGREFAPEDFWRLTCEVIREALYNSGLNARDIAGVSSTSQREGMVFLDGEGRELYAGPNIDLRAVMDGILIDSKYAQEIHAITGHLPSLLFAPAKLKWFEHNQPDAFSQIAGVLTINDWIIHKLCGELVSELCSAAEAGLVDVAHRTWSRELTELLDLPQGIYPPLAPAGSRLGEVTGRATAETGIAEGTPVVQGAPDTHCGLIGMGVAGPGEMGIVTGWSAPVQMVTANPIFDTGGRVWTGCHLPADRWILESNAGEAGNSFRWLMEILFGQDEAAPEVYNLMDQMALSVPPGAEGTLAFIGPSTMDMSHLQPMYGGFLFPLPPSVAGISRAHLVRAALENICFAIKANLRQLEAISGLKSESISVGGRLTQSLGLKHILPAVLDGPVRFARVTEVSGLGAAMCAAAGSGIYASVPEAMEHMRSEFAVLDPDPLAASEYHDCYQQWASADKLLQRMKGPASE